MAHNIDDELGRFGINRVTFDEVIQEVKAVLYPSWTDEEMMFHRRETDEYLRTVMARLQCFDIPDHLILRGLVKLRKNPDC